MARPRHPHRLSLSQSAPDADDQVALAVYELSDERPEGVTKNGVTYRQQVLDDRLVGAAIGDPGEAEVSLRFTVPAGELRASETCFGEDVGIGTGYMVMFSVDGRDVWGASCSDRSTYDQGSDGGSIASALRRAGVQAGDEVELRARLVRERRGGEPVAGTDAVLGIAAYEDGGDTARVAGWDLPERLEHAGHEWVLSHVSESATGEPALTATLDARERPMLVVTAVNGLANGARVRLDVDGVQHDASEFYTGPDAGSWSPDLTLEPGTGREVSQLVRRGLTEDTRLAIALYELVH